MKFLSIAIACAAASALSAHAVTFIYEPFDYTDGASLNGNSGATGLGAWSAGSDATNVINNPDTYNSGSLNVSGGESHQLNNNDGSVAVTADMSSNLADGTSLWFSIVLAGDLGGSNYHGGFALGTDGVAGSFNGVNISNSGDALGVYIKGSADATSWVAGAREGQGSGGDALSLSSTPQLLVGRFDWGASSDTITLWTISDLSSLPDESTLTAGSSSTHTSSNVDQTLFDTVSYAYRDTTTEGQINDEIRFGSTYNDVVVAIPETSSALLGGLGALLLLRRRRG